MNTTSIPSPRRYFTKTGLIGDADSRVVITEIIQEATGKLIDFIDISLWPMSMVQRRQISHGLMLDRPNLIGAWGM